MEEMAQGGSLPPGFKSAMRTFTDASGDFDFDRKFKNGDFAAWCEDPASGSVVFDVSARGREMAKKFFPPADDSVLREAWPQDVSKRLYDEIVSEVKASAFRPMMDDIQAGTLDHAWERPLEYAIAYKMCHRRKQRTDPSVPNISIRLGRMGWRTMADDGKLSVHWELG